MMLTPLILAGILTLATIVVIGLPLNFANIIALPLLLSLGVSYAIYFVSYWRAGMTRPLQSSMARAVFFSAATVLVAFGSLAISSHPGTAGMGKLLTVALLYCLTCAFFILPPLLGPNKPDKH
jgi:predicted RND superfamily exporter protein